MSLLHVVAVVYHVVGRFRVSVDYLVSTKCHVQFLYLPAYRGSEEQQRGAQCKR